MRERACFCVALVIVLSSWSWGFWCQIPHVTQNVPDAFLRHGDISSASPKGCTKDSVRLCRGAYQLSWDDAQEGLLFLNFIGDPENWETGSSRQSRTLSTGQLPTLPLCVYMCVCVCMYVCMLVAQSCPTLCDPMDCSSPGSSVYGILQARKLEWVAIPFSRGYSQPRGGNTFPYLAVTFLGNHEGEETRGNIPNLYP